MIVHVVAACAAASVNAQPVSYDFSVVTDLARGAIEGRNVATPVPGFDLLLIKDGRTVYHESFGDWSLNRVANADSATKTLSAALILSLTESSAQPFSLSSRLVDFIPQFNGAKAGITIAQCFSHTSGLYAQSLAVGDASITLQEAARRIAAAPLRDAPGSVFLYGGVSMHAAGAAAEAAGSQPWNTLFLNRIRAPLGLVRTRFVLTSPDNPRIAGGCESTAEEFARFMEMLRRGGLHGNTRILSEASVAAMFTRQPPIGIPIAGSPLDGSADYGVGVWLDQRDTLGGLTGALAAGARGFSSWIDFDDGMVGVFATDTTSSGNIQPLLYQIRAAAEAAIRHPLPCFSDFNQDGGIDGDDVIAFFAAWELGGDDADVNADGGVDGMDIAAFFARWELGVC